ncbi:hypothetical protein PMIN03_005272 [Paraphaeosphaeria minitans]
MSSSGNRNIRLGGFAIPEVQVVEEMIVDLDNGPAGPSPANPLQQEPAETVTQPTAILDEQGRHLPSREQFMDPGNAEGLLALSDPRAVESAPVQAFNNSRTQAHANDCGICNSEMTDLDEAVFIVRCGHTYHRSCLLRWFDIDVRIHRCPYCARTLFVESQQQPGPSEPTGVPIAPDFTINGSEDSGILGQGLQIPTEAGPDRGADMLGSFAENPTSVSDAEMLRPVENQILQMNEQLEQVEEDEESRLQPEEE